MFIGTTDHHNPGRVAPVVARRLTDTRLPAAGKAEDDAGVLTLLLVPQGCSGVLHGHRTDKLRQGLELRLGTPFALCLGEGERLELSRPPALPVCAVRFRVEFLNRSLCLSLLRSEAYPALCDQHALFQLSPFLCDDAVRHLFPLTPEAWERFASLFAMLEHHLRVQPDMYWSCCARSYFIDLIGLLEKRFHRYGLRPNEALDLSEEPAPPDGDHFAAVLEYLCEHLEEPLTLPAVGARFGLNKNRVEELFRLHLNTTFHAYLSRLRYERASYYLRYTELTADHIAGRVGISSSQNFCKFFKRMSGASPGVFRRNAVAARRGDPLLNAGA